jgi:hypothetical protein
MFYVVFSYGLIFQYFSKLDFLCTGSVNFCNSDDEIFYSSETAVQIVVFSNNCCFFPLCEVAALFSVKWKVKKRPYRWEQLII